MARQVSPEDRERARLGGIWLRETRQRHGYATGIEFAEALGIRQVRLSSYENGNYQVEVRVARRIAEVLGLSEWEVWRGLRLPLPRELDDDEAIAKAEELLPEVMRKFSGGKTRKATPLPPGSVSRRTRDTRRGEKRRDVDPGRESAV